MNPHSWKKRKSSKGQVRSALYVETRVKWVIGQVACSLSPDKREKKKKARSSIFKLVIVLCSACFRSHSPSVSVEGLRPSAWKYTIQQWFARLKALYKPTTWTSGVIWNGKFPEFEIYRAERSISERCIQPWLLLAVRVYHEYWARLIVVVKTLLNFLESDIKLFTNSSYRTIVGLGILVRSQGGYSQSPPASNSKHDFALEVFSSSNTPREILGICCVSRGTSC